MLKKAGYIALPLIVLAGMRRCPQMRMPEVPCHGCSALTDLLPPVLILSSVVALVAVAALVIYKRREAL